MSNRARDPGLPARVRDLEELVRRLGTRIPSTDDPVPDWQDLTPYIGQGTDFAGDPDFVTSWETVSLGLGVDQECPRYYIDRDRVWLAGMVRYFGTPEFLVNDWRYPLRMPPEARPALDSRVPLFPHPEYTAHGTERDFWTGYVVAGAGVGGGLLALYTFEILPTHTAFVLDGLSYRLSQ